MMFIFFIICPLFLPVPELQTLLQKTTGYHRRLLLLHSASPDVGCIIARSQFRFNPKAAKQHLKSELRGLGSNKRSFIGPGRKFFSRAGSFIVQFQTITPAEDAIASVELV